MKATTCGRPHVGDLVRNRSPDAGGPLRKPLRVVRLYLGHAEVAATVGGGLRDGTAVEPGDRFFLREEDLEVIR